MLVVDHAIEQVGAVATGGVRDYAHAGRGGCQAEGDLHLADFVHGAGLQRGPMEKFTSPVTGWWGAGFFYRGSRANSGGGIAIAFRSEERRVGKECYV